MDAVGRVVDCVHERLYLPDQTTRTGSNAISTEHQFRCSTTFFAAFS